MESGESASESVYISDVKYLPGITEGINAGDWQDMQLLNVPSPAYQSK